MFTGTGVFVLHATFINNCVCVWGFMYYEIHPNSKYRVRNLQGIFLMEALPRVLPWCMAHHFNVRVYSQGTLITLWNLAKQYKLKPVLQKHSIVESFVEFSNENKYVAMY